MSRPSAAPAPANDPLDWQPAAAEVLPSPSPFWLPFWVVPPLPLPSPLPTVIGGETALQWPGSGISVGNGVPTMPVNATLSMFQPGPPVLTSAPSRNRMRNVWPARLVPRLSATVVVAGNPGLARP